MTILVINAGSSSVKFAAYASAGLEVIVRGVVDEAPGGAQLRVQGPRAADLASNDHPPCGDHAAQIRWLLDTLIARMPDIQITAAGHRVVHGGVGFLAPTLVDEVVVAKLSRLIPLAPAHQPHNLAGIGAVSAYWPGLPQVACFDTAFHRTQPRLAQLFAIPRALSDQGLVRYGFHGLAYQHIADTLPAIAGERAHGRIIAAHLGSGASLCAMSGARSVATTMGLTALDGLMMGARSGNVDPGLVLHLIRERGMSVDDVADLLGNKSGLLGVSGLSADVRALEASDDPNAVEALDLFGYRVAREAGSLVSALGGLDALIFSGGIGEHSARMRQRIAARLQWTGLELDQDRNQAGEVCISAEGASVAAYIIAANEEEPIARATRNIVFPFSR